MRKRNLILLILFMVVVPLLLSGCFHRPREAVLTLELSPNPAPLNTSVMVVERLRELSGVGVSLNYVKEEIYDQWGISIGGWEVQGPAAELIFQGSFGTFYISANGELSRTYAYSTGIQTRWVRTYGGIDDNGYTVGASAEIIFGP